MKPLVFLALAALAGSSFAQTPSTMRVAGNFSSNKNHVDAIERPFFTALPAQRLRTPSAPSRRF